MRRRVVITGMGWLTPLGDDIDGVWQRILDGVSGVGPITLFDASTFPTTFAAEVKDCDLAGYCDDPDLLRWAGRNSKFAIIAAVRAWRHAALAGAAGLDRSRLGIYLGGGEGEMDFDNFVELLVRGWDPAGGQVNMAAWGEHAKALLSGRREFEQEPNMPVSHMAKLFGAKGPAYTALTACAASTQALGEAAEIIRRGDADVMIAGGAHSMIHPMGITGFNLLTALSTRNDEPQTASRPFERDRDGFVIGEGAGICILEEYQFARNRGATLHAEVIGYGSTADAFAVTDTHPDGLGAARCMEAAIADAGVTLRDIDYISAHGTGTRANDATETKAIHLVFGEHAGEVPISSIKSMMGHLIAAAGVVELITCVLAIRDNIVPATTNLFNRDPELDLDYVPNAFRRRTVNVALSNSFGFGGQNDTLIIRRCDPA
jgi:3-oxoacyl-[acyl-carrier-protein] synthase II